MMSGGRGAGGDYDQITHARMLEAMLVYSSVGGALAAIMIRLHTRAERTELVNSLCLEVLYADMI